MIANNENGTVDPLKEDTRVKFVFNDLTYYINPPSAEAIRKSEWHHAKVYNEAVAEGVYTSHEMEGLLKGRGLLGEEYERELSVSRSHLQDALMRLELANLDPDTEDEELEKIALEVARARDDLYRLNLRFTNPMNTTCEKLAEDAKIDFIISSVIVDASGKKVWPTYADYMNDTNFNFILTAKTQVYLWLQGIDGDILNKIPENVVFKRIDEKRKEKVQTALDEITKAIATANESENMSTPLLEESMSSEDGNSKKKTKKKKQSKEEDAQISDIAG